MNDYYFCKPTKGADTELRSFREWLPSSHLFFIVWRGCVPHRVTTLLSVVKIDFLIIEGAYRLHSAMQIHPNEEFEVCGHRG